MPELVPIRGPEASIENPQPEPEHKNNRFEAHGRPMVQTGRAPTEPDRFDERRAMCDVRAAFSTDTEGTSEREDEEATTSMKPTCLNAFDIISLSPGFDLSDLFENETNHRPEARFTIKQPAATIVKKFEEIAETE